MTLKAAQSRSQRIKDGISARRARVQNTGEQAQALQRAQEVVGLKSTAGADAPAPSPSPLFEVTSNSVSDHSTSGHPTSGHPTSGQTAYCFGSARAQRWRAGEFKCHLAPYRAIATEPDLWAQHL